MDSYHKDISSFSEQIKTALANANLKAPGSNDYKRAVICGMGGSSYYVELLQNIFSAEDISFKLLPNRTYRPPIFSGNETLYILTSHSGGTEEVLTCLAEIREKNLPYVIITAGGELLEHAHKNNIPHYQIPQNVHSRLATGYFIASVIKLLENSRLIPIISKSILDQIEKLNPQESYAKEMTEKLKGKLPIIYASEENHGIARIAKIKINETAKIQAFWNYFPEINHNEMVSFTNKNSNPVILFVNSSLVSKRNKQRMKVSSEILKEYDIEVIDINIEDKDIYTELFSQYLFFDYLSYYLALEYNTDPGPVKMVDKFKSQLFQ